MLSTEILLGINLGSVVSIYHYPLNSTSFYYTFTKVSKDEWECVVKSTLKETDPLQYWESNLATVTSEELLTFIVSRRAREISTITNFMETHYAYKIEAR